MRNWQKAVPPYAGDEPYLYCAFAEGDSKKVWKILQPLVERGCRVWYCVGPAGSADELLRRQERSGGAALTLLYLTDAACDDKDTKTNVLVNQKNERPILCLDPDGTDRRLAMGLRETVPHLPLYRMERQEDIENAVLHAEGFSQEMLGEPVTVRDGGVVKKLTVVLTVLASLLLAVTLVGVWWLHWFLAEPQDELTFTDPVILTAMREAARGGVITEELAAGITCLRLDGMPESWDELALLPALERIELPQQALLTDAALPEGPYTVILRGGGA